MSAEVTCFNSCQASCDDTPIHGCNAAGKLHESITIGVKLHTRSYSNGFLQCPARSKLACVHATSLSSALNGLALNFDCLGQHIESPASRGYDALDIVQSGLVAA